MPDFGRLRGIFVALSVALSTIQAATAASPADQVSIRDVKDAAGKIVAIEAGPLPESVARKLQKVSAEDQAAFAQVLYVVLDEAAAANAAPMAGSYSLREQTLRFTPQFAFRAGEAYRAVLRKSEGESSSAGNGGDVVHRFHLPARKAAPAAEVVTVYPSSETLPENLLRFYVHFSAPMARGQAYDHVQLLDEKKQPIELAFLEIGEEFWDPDQQRLTLLFDPGRIKRGLKPREDVGSALQEGKQYTLVVRSTWPDAEGKPLRKEYSKTFRVGPPIELAINQGEWKITAPPAGSREPLTIEFPRPLDYALLNRMLQVRTAAGTPVEGKVVVSDHEHRWQWQPTSVWQTGKYEVVVDGELEDLAGNRIGRAFDLAITSGADAPPPPKSVKLTIEIKAPRPN